MPRALFFRTVWLITLALGTGVHARCAEKPELHEMLQRLQANLEHYDKALPNLYYEEHIVSTQTGPRQRDERKNVDAVFRLRRVTRPDHTSAFVETRQVKRVNGEEPDAHAPLELPAQLSGLFEGSLAVVSLDQALCMQYTVVRPHGKREGPLTIRFKTTSHASACILHEKSKGEAEVNSTAMQVTRVEIVTPHHVIIPGGYETPRITGERVLAATYAPVALGGESFWLPQAIHMTDRSDGFRGLQWSFDATYSNCHRLEVTTRILPGYRAP